MTGHGNHTNTTDTARGFWLAAGVLGVVAIFKILHDTLDPNCFWHLRVADQLLRDGIGPLVDEISFASLKQPWTPYSWLAELGMKALWDLTGYHGAVIASALAACAFVLLVAASCIELAGPHRRFNALMVTALAACLALPYLSFRPATAAIVLLALCTWLLLLDRRLNERSKAVWLIIPLTILIVNVHLMAFIMPALVGCLLAGAAIERADERTRRIRRYAILLIATGLACLMTPMLPGVLRACWDYQFTDVMVASGGIEEMRPIYATTRGAAVLAAVALLLVIALLNRRAVRIGQWLWIALAAILLLRLGRFAPIFAMLAAPVLAATLPAMPDIVLVRRPLQVGAALTLALGVIYCIFQMPSRNTPLSTWLNRNGPEAFGYPCAATDYVDRHVTPATGRLINEFTWGGYLRWRLGDRFQVLLDGRTQLYSAEFWRSTYLCDDTTRIRTFQSIRADAAVLPVDDSVFRSALLNLGWTRAYIDDRAEVLVPPAAHSNAAN